MTYLSNQSTKTKLSPQPQRSIPRNVSLMIWRWPSLLNHPNDANLTQETWWLARTLWNEVASANQSVWGTETAGNNETASFWRHWNRYTNRQSFADLIRLQENESKLIQKFANEKARAQAHLQATLALQEAECETTWKNGCINESYRSHNANPFLEWSWTYY